MFILLEYDRLLPLDLEKVLIQSDDQQQVSVTHVYTLSCTYRMCYPANELYILYVLSSR